jgi:hypothetical protein
MYFSGLETNSAVALTNGKFVVALVPGTYMFGDTEAEVPTITDYINKNRQVLVDSFENIKIQKTEKGALTHYVDDEGKIISIKDYKIVKDKLDDAQASGYDFHKDIWVDFYKEAEYKSLRKEIGIMHPKYAEDKIYFEDLEIKCVLWSEDTGSDFIETPFNYGKISFDNKNGIYKVLRGKIVDDVWNIVKSEAPPRTVFESKQAGFHEFSKINGTYVWGGSRAPSYIKWETDSLVFETLEEAQQEETRLRKKIYSTLKVLVEPEKEISRTTRVALLKELRNLASSISSVDPKTKTQRIWTRANNQVRNLIDVLSEDT